MNTPCRTVLIVALVGTVAAVAAARGGRGGADMPRYTDSMSAGDVAFSVPLETLDGKGTFDLAARTGRPVALVFGSYT